MAGRDLEVTHGTGTRDDQKTHDSELLPHARQRELRYSPKPVLRWQKEEAPGVNAGG